MIDESKLIFYTGAPGSKWSATAHLLTKSTKISINTSDYLNGREHYHPGPNIKHQGGYWGPGFEFGEKFHEINTLSKEEIIAEIERPYTDRNWDQYRIIKCHQFSLNLNFIKEAFPTSKIMIVIRSNNACTVGWKIGGGFDITYPNYTPYYKDYDTMAAMTALENANSRAFIYDNNLEIHMQTKAYWGKYWAVDTDNEEAARYIASICRKTESNGTWIPRYDTAISCYNFNEVF
jgi:hypothetical protein